MDSLEAPAEGLEDVCSPKSALVFVFLKGVVFKGLQREITRVGPLFEDKPVLVT